MMNVAAPTPIAKFRCTYVAAGDIAHRGGQRQCEHEGTHRVTLRLRSADGALVKRVTLGLERRCPEHQPPFAREFTSDHEMWMLMVKGFITSAIAFGHGEIHPVRSLTEVQYTKEDEQVGTVEVLAPREDGKLEPLGKARLIK